MTLFATAPRPLRSILIANRGEIACRVIRSCHRLGLRAVAVYSDADAGAMHVRMADEAHRIGAAAAAASYLDIDAVLAAARASGADAIHPGYGFLSENAAFVRRCEAAGFAFVGPSAAAVAAMGSKIEAKRIAIAAGIPVVPGYHGADQTPALLAAEAERIGFPLLVKASAGGGGRGMRLVADAGSFLAELATAKAEALAAFGDESVLLEKFVANPRHLEVQLFGDTHGNLVHLFERDCSVQRNNQKIFEEAPAPNLPDTVRETLFAAALQLGRSIGYHSAGTVEFIMAAGTCEPYFLEVNSRLQVEHPVTEAITGIDLVEWQLRVAAGLPLPLAQGEIRAKGHAIEARLAAERADAGFQPSIGQLSLVALPAGLRVDAGIESGSAIGLFYDSLLAKLIAHRPDRAAALAQLDRGLADLAVLGPVTNQAFLRSCLARPDFADGRATTGFVPQNFPGGWQPDSAALARLRALAAAFWCAGPADESARPWLRRTGFRVMSARRPAWVDLELTDDYGTSKVRLAHGRDGFSALVDDRPVALGHLDPADGAGFMGRALFHRRDGDRVQLSHDGLSISATMSLAIDAERQTQAAPGRSGRLHAPLPGIVTGIPVAVGDPVAAGQTLLQMEAMKLVHSLTAPAAGTVAAIHCAVGDTVPANAVLVEVATETVEEEEETGDGRTVV